jgi:GNAT superfamily N-acetyltransferase
MNDHLAADAPSIEVRPATADRFDDVAAILSPRGTGVCWCLYYRLTSGDYSRLAQQDRPDFIRELLAHTPAPGVLAYLDGVPVGWCGMGPRTEMGRRQRSRTIPTIDDRPVWSVLCFVVRPGFRRRGITRALLDGVIDYARRSGAWGLEAYPVDPGDRRIHQSAAHVGTTAMFEAAGFRRIVQTRATSAELPRWLMRLPLSEPTT